MPTLLLVWAERASTLLQVLTQSLGAVCGSLTCSVGDGGVREKGLGIKHQNWVHQSINIISLGAGCALQKDFTGSETQAIFCSLCQCPVVGLYLQGGGGTFPLFSLSYYMDYLSPVANARNLSQLSEGLALYPLFLQITL